MVRTGCWRSAAVHLLVTAQVFIVALGIATAFLWFDAANSRGCAARVAV